MTGLRRFVGRIDWLKLPVRAHDHAVNTPRGALLVPRVIVAANYSKVPMQRPTFGPRGNSTTRALKSP